VESHHGASQYVIAHIRYRNNVLRAWRDRPQRAKHGGVSSFSTKTWRGTSIFVPLVVRLVIQRQHAACRSQEQPRSAGIKRISHGTVRSTAIDGICRCRPIPSIASRAEWLNFSTNGSSISRNRTT
jgi:hypothetical protein